MKLKLVALAALCGACLWVSAPAQNTVVDLPLVMALEQAAAGNQRPLGASASFPRPGSGVGPVGIYPQSLWTDWRS